MTTVGAYEAKTHLGELLERAEKGETILITKHGVPVATLGPAPGAAKLSVDEAIEGILEVRKRNTLGGISIRDLIEEGRRY